MNFGTFEPDEKLKALMTDKALLNMAHKPSLKKSVGLKDKLLAVLPVLSAIANGKEISLERQEERLKICSECENLSLINGKLGCGVCGCKLKIDDRSIVNLVSLEETEKYGCKHPDGSKWLKAGV